MMAQLWMDITVWATAIWAQLQAAPDLAEQYWALMRGRGQSDGSMVQSLLASTPFLWGGYMGNLWISVLAMAAGTLIGGLIGLIRVAYQGLTGWIARFLTDICRNVPSFVLLFYMAFMIPNEIAWRGETILVPIWFKAVVALTFPVVGFASDQTRAYFDQMRAGLEGAAETFFVAWVQYFLIIIMASAVASVIGADEIVGRANTVISRTEDARFLLLTYGYTSLWFLATGLLISGLLKSTIFLLGR